MFNSHTIFGSKSISTLKIPFMKVWAFCCFDRPVSFHGDEIVQSQVNSHLQWVELWTNFIYPLSGGQEERGDSEINLLSAENDTEAISPLIMLYSSIYVSHSSTYR